MPAVTKPVPPVITVEDRANVVPGATKDAPQPATKNVTPAAAAAQPARRAGSDRLDLDTTVVTGNRELPKVLYIVPWKRSELGDMPPQPLNTLLDEVLTPVDRDVFRREVTYYGAMSAPDGAADALPVPPAAASEK